VRGFDPTTMGAYSIIQSFKTPSAPAASPAPGGGGGGGSCASAGSPNAIVLCRRKQWGHMSNAEIVVFLRSVAKDLHAAGVAAGPFGILRKTTGNNCGGYSCDIICNNGGSGWDILADSDGAQTAHLESASNLKVGGAQAGLGLRIAF